VSLRLAVTAQLIKQTAFGQTYLRAKGKSFSLSPLTRADHLAGPSFTGPRISVIGSGNFFPLAIVASVAHCYQPNRGLQETPVGSAEKQAVISSPGGDDDEVTAHGRLFGIGGPGDALREQQVERGVRCVGV
jgi:hypothetical protein